MAARQRFEDNLPVDRPQTEPDVSLFLPGKYVIHIECKFTSKNTFYRRGPRKNGSSLTLDELIGIYQDKRLRMLDTGKAEEAERIHYQLWRNMIFSEWMAAEDHPNTKAFHVNLVRDGYDEYSASEFERLVMPRYRDRFQRLTWEQLYHLYRDEPKLSLMKKYLETKTAGLKRAFKL